MTPEDILLKLSRKQTFSSFLIQVYCDIISENQLQEAKKYKYE